MTSANAPHLKILECCGATTVPRIHFTTATPAPSLRQIHSSTTWASPKSRILPSKIVPLVAQTSDWAQQEEEEESVESDGGGLEEDSYSEPSEEAKLFVGNLPYDVDSEKLAQMFDRAGVVEISEEMARTRRTARKRIPIAAIGEAFQLENPRPHNRAHAALCLKELTIENQDRTIQRLRASNLERRKRVESLTSRLTSAERKIDDVCHMLELTKDHNYGLRESLDTAMEQTRRAKEYTDQHKQELTEAKKARLEDGRKIDESWTAILRLTECNHRLNEMVDKGKEKKKKLLEKHAECHTEYKNRLNEAIAALHTRDSEIIDLKFEKQNLQWQIEDMMEPEEPEEDPEEEEAPPDAAIGNGEIE